MTRPSVGNFLLWWKQTFLGDPNRSMERFGRKGITDFRISVSIMAKCLSCSLQSDKKQAATRWSRSIAIRLFKLGTYTYLLSLLVRSFWILVIASSLATATKLRRVNRIYVQIPLAPHAHKKPDVFSVQFINQLRTGITTVKYDELFGLGVNLNQPLMCRTASSRLDIPTLSKGASTMKSLGTS